jgi:hypothetical protein
MYNHICVCVVSNGKLYSNPKVLLSNLFKDIIIVIEWIGTKFRRIDGLNQLVHRGRHFDDVMAEELPEIIRKEIIRYNFYD